VKGDQGQEGKKGDGQEEKKGPGEKSVILARSSQNQKIIFNHRGNKGHRVFYIKISSL